MALAKATFFLPMKDSDDRDLLADHEAVRWIIYDLFDGWTFLGYVEGAFRMSDGTHALDRSAAYVVVLQERRIEELEATLREFKARTLQAAIYLEIQRNVEFRFVN